MPEEESFHKFPCEFSIKVIGKKTDDFEIAVLSIIRKHFKNLDENAIKTNPSKNSNYLSLTITITAQSKKQLDAVYMDLKDCDEVIMAL